MKNNEHKPGQIVIYQPDYTISLEVKIEGESVWLNRHQIAQLFDRDIKTIGKHINNALIEELASIPVVAKFATTAADGKIYQVEYYNLDVILSVGYRVKSNRGIQFRRWANTILKQYLLQGFSVNNHLIALQQQLDGRFIAIEKRIEDQQQDIDFLVDMHQQPVEALFSTGCVWDAWAFLSNLIRSARDRIILIDNYVDERTLLLLDKRQEGVSCIVHTRFSRQTELDFEKHNRQSTPIEKVQLSHQVHDRYLIIDDTVWLLGASVKDMGRGLCTVIEVDFTPDDVLGKLK